jgi:hypothetical protein
MACPDSGLFIKKHGNGTGDLKKAPGLHLLGRKVQSWVFKVVGLISGLSIKNRGNQT